MDIFRSFDIPVPKGIYKERKPQFISSIVCSIFFEDIV